MGLPPGATTPTQISAVERTQPGVVFKPHLALLERCNSALMMLRLPDGLIFCGRSKLVFPSGLRAAPPTRNCVAL